MMLGMDNGNFKHGFLTVYLLSLARG